KYYRHVCCGRDDHVTVQAKAAYVVYIIAASIAFIALLSAEQFWALFVPILLVVLLSIAVFMEYRPTLLIFLV
ncbi:hypothetical protein PFISCL1PPCAC_9300, partial [Pristionchus fissidentatus]